jgi:hypothetical protein
MYYFQTWIPAKIWYSNHDWILSAQKFNSNTVGFNFQKHIFIDLHKSNCKTLEDMLLDGFYKRPVIPMRKYSQANIGCRWYIYLLFQFVWFMVFTATFNNITVESWRSISLVEETRASGENHVVWVQILLRENNNFVSSKI